MNLGQVQAALLRDLIQRDDVNAEALQNSVRYAHRELQLHWNWRCMYTRLTDLEYPANNTTGVVVESATGADDCKHIIEAFLQNGDGSLTTLWPSTQEGAARDRRISQIAQNQQPAEDAGWMQKWYDRGRAVALLIPPTVAVDLTVDFYRYLPFYPTSFPSDLTVDPTANDFFSDNMAHVLQAGAAYWLCKNSLDDNRAETFQARFLDEAKMAYENDRLARQGGMSQSYSPPTAQQARAAGATAQG